MIIRIADIPLEWQSDYSDFVKDFECDTGESPVMNLEFISQMNSIHGIQYTDRPSERVLKLETGEFLLADSRWEKCTVFTDRRIGSDHSLPLAAICSRLAKVNTLFMHASVIDLCGEGVIFAGFSGVGKTTQAQLWEKYMGADIINGDKAFLRFKDGGFYAYGCPWKGSSEYCLNTKTALKGIVVLRQADDNRITRLDAAKAIELFMPHVFLPHWDTECLQKSLDTLDRLTKEIPMWLLECRPDEDAVKLTYSKVFENGKN